jgi:hypothetical protein
VHVVTLLGAGVVLLRANWSQWFFGDEWEFLVARDVGDDPAAALFAPHNEHWSTLPVLVWRGLLHVVGLESYLPYAAVLVLLHLALAHVLWRVLRRTGCEPWLATGLAATFAVLGAGSENLLWAFQIGFVGSVLFGYLAALVVDGAMNGARGLVAAWLLCLGSLMCSGIGLVMVGVVALVACQRRGVRRAMAVVSVPAAAFTIWYVGFGRDDGSSVPKSPRGLLAVPDYVASGLTQSLERVVGLPSAGGALVILILAWLALRLRSGAAPLVLSTAAGSVALYALIAPGREALGIESAGASRYTYICIALLLPAAGGLLTDVLARTPWPALLGAALSVVLVWHNGYLLVGTFGAEAGREAAIRRQVLAAADIATTQSWLRNRPEPVLDPDITMEWLQEARRSGWLDEDEGDYTAKDELDVRSRTQVALDAAATPALPVMRVLAAARVATAVEGNCVRYLPTAGQPQVVLALDPVNGGSARLFPSQPGEVRVHLSRSAAPTVMSEPVAFQVNPTTDGAHLRVNATVDRMTLTLPEGGTTLVCGLAQPTG